MHRSRWQRAFAAALAAWFSLVMVDPGVLHACPVHSGEQTSAAAATSGTGHAAHGALSAPEATADQGAPASSHDHGSCTCSTECGAGRTTVVAAPPQGTVAIVFIGRAQAPLPSAATRPASAPPYFLPFANGPPSFGLA